MTEETARAPLRETNKFVPKSKPLFFLALVGMVLVLLFFRLVCAFVQEMYGINWVSILPFAAALAVVMYLFAAVIREYHYTLYEQKLVVERSSGRRRVEYVTVHLSAVTGYDPWDGQSKPDFMGAIKRSPQPKMALRFKNRKKGESVLVLAPSAQLDARLREALEHPEQAPRE